MAGIKRSCREAQTKLVQYAKSPTKKNQVKLSGVRCASESDESSADDQSAFALVSLFALDAEKEEENDDEPR